MNYCSRASLPNFDPYEVNKKECDEFPDGVWKRREFNFDNIALGMITLFVFSSLEAWPTLMFHILDGCEYKKGKE
jgi:hypothetical protein